MSTNDVPGAVAQNADELSMGCWAEHDDGSLLFVESTEGGRVVFCLWDRKEKPLVEYRTALPLDEFESTFSWGKGAKDKWTWHDKTPFDWNEVIRAGAKEGPRFPSAEQQLSAAARVAKSLALRARRWDPKRSAHLRPRTTASGNAVIANLQAAIDELREKVDDLARSDEDTGEFEPVE